MAYTYVVGALALLIDSRDSSYHLFSLDARRTLPCALTVMAAFGYDTVL